MELGHNSSRTVENARVTPPGYKYTHGGGGGGGTLPGKFCIFRYKFIAFKAMFMCFISRSLSLKIRIYRGGQPVALSHQNATEASKCATEGLARVVHNIIYHIVLKLKVKVYFAS